MDCRGFRKQHFAYLDDTLPGDTMAEAQRHIMRCDSCAAHDTMVRRSLMLVRNMSVIEPSVEFRQRMQARLNEARAETARDKFRAAEGDHKAPHPARKQPMVLTAIAATALIAGSLAWQQRVPHASSLVSLQPVTVSTPDVDTSKAEIYVDPGVVRAMATGNPMWPAALMIDDTPAQVMTSGFIEVKGMR